jgi:hypothetical protein
MAFSVNQFVTTRRFAQNAAVFIGAVAAGGVLLEQGNDLSNVGWSRWSEGAISGVDVILLLVTIPLVLFLAGVAMTEAVGIHRRERAKTLQYRQEFKEYTQARPELRTRRDLDEPD